MKDKIVVLPLNRSYIKQLKEFCDFSDRAGYHNNASIEQMKFGGKYDLIEIPRFWAAFYNDKIISVSGSHLLEDNTGLRCLFRSATLPEYDKMISGLSKNHMTSLPFSMILPLQINNGLGRGIRNFYITTSSNDHDASGKMKKTHRVMQLLEKNRIVSHCEDRELYSVIQSKWKIDLDVYLAAIRNFYKSKKESNLFFDQEYIKIVEQGFKIV